MNAIRRDEETLARQLKLAGCEERANLPFQKAILDKKLPYTIGGGIGQSRICMFYLRKAHIGEIQVSLWPEEIRETAKENGIILLWIRIQRIKQEKGLLQQLLLKCKQRNCRKRRIGVYRTLPVVMLVFIHGFPTY